MNRTKLLKLLKRATAGWEKKWKDDPSKPVEERIQAALDARYGTREELEAASKESQEEFRQVMVKSLQDRINMVVDSYLKEYINIDSFIASLKELAIECYPNVSRTATLRDKPSLEGEKQERIFKQIDELKDIPDDDEKLRQQSLTVCNLLENI